MSTARPTTAREQRRRLSFAPDNDIQIVEQVMDDATMAALGISTLKSNRPGTAPLRNKTMFAPKPLRTNILTQKKVVIDGRMVETATDAAIHDLPRASPHVDAVLRVTGARRALLAVPPPPVEPHKKRSHDSKKSNLVPTVTPDGHWIDTPTVARNDGVIVPRPPRAPALPASLFSVSHPPKGAFNPVFYLRHYYYQQSATTGLVSKKVYFDPAAHNVASDQLTAFAAAHKEPPMPPLVAPHTTSSNASVAAAVPLPSTPSRSTTPVSHVHLPDETAVLTALWAHEPFSRPSSPPSRSLIPNCVLKSTSQSTNPTPKSTRPTTPSQDLENKEQEQSVAKPNSSVSNSPVRRARHGSYMKSPQSSGITQITEDEKNNPENSMNPQSYEARQEEEEFSRLINALHDTDANVEELFAAFEMMTQRLDELSWRPWSTLTVPTRMAHGIISCIQRLANDVSLVDQASKLLLRLLESHVQMPNAVLPKISDIVKNIAAVNAVRKTEASQTQVSDSHRSLRRHGSVSGTRPPGDTPSMHRIASGSQSNIFSRKKLDNPTGGSRASRSELAPMMRSSPSHRSLRELHEEEQEVIITSESSSPLRSTLVSSTSGLHPNLSNHSLEPSPSSLGAPLESNIAESRTAFPSSKRLNANNANNAPMSITNSAQFRLRLVSTTNQLLSFVDLRRDDTSLISHLVRTYFDGTLMSQLDRLATEERLDLLRSVTTFFAKIGKFLNIVRLLESRLDVYDAFSLVAKEAAVMVQAESALIYVVHPETKRLRFFQNLDVKNENDITSFDSDYGIVGHVITHGETVRCDDVANSKHFRLDIDAPKNVQVQSTLTVPIRLLNPLVDESNEHGNQVGEVMAAIHLVNKGDPSDPKFNSEDECLIRLLAGHLSNVVTQTMKSGKFGQHTEGRQQIRKSQTIHSTHNLLPDVALDDLLHEIMNSARSLLNAERCTLFLVDHEKHELTAEVQGLDGPERIQLDMSTGIAGYVASTGQSVNVADAYKDARFNSSIDQKTGYLTKSLLTVPLQTVQGQVIGVAQVMNKNSSTNNNRFDHNDEMLLSSFADQAAKVMAKSFDIKKAESHRHLLERSLQSLTCAVMTFNGEGRLLWCNRSWFIDALGRTEEELHHLTVEHWLAENNPTLLADLKHVYLAQEDVYAPEYEFRSDDLSTMLVTYTITPVHLPASSHSSSGVVLMVEALSNERQMAASLGRLFTPSTIKRLLTSDVLNGLRQKVTLLCAQVREMMTMTEMMDASEVVQIINQLLNDTNESAQFESGHLIHFNGDQVQVVFGTPFAGQTEDAMHAVNAALRLQNKILKFNEARPNADPLHLHVGLHTGDALHGNLGHGKRMEFSVIGQSAATAHFCSRLAQFYGVKILITQFTKDDLDLRLFKWRDLDTIEYGGKEIQLFEIIGRFDEILRTNLQNGYEKYDQALHFYRESKFDEALSLFKESKTLLNDDGPSSVFVERCLHHLENPAPAEWVPIHSIQV